MTEATQLVTQKQGGAVVEHPAYAESAPLSVQDIVGQVALIREIQREVMQEGQHFGTIPGCGDKPTLLKPGAEKLMLTFRMAAFTDVDVIDMPNGHREYRVKTELRDIKTGRTLGHGVGSCSTMESKYRYRTGPKELTDKPVPKEFWNLRKSDPAKAQEMLGGKGFSTAKNDAGAWVIAIQGEKVEHDNPADYYNTALKIAKKRSVVDASLTVTAASDIFTQDIEENPELYGGKHDGQSGDSNGSSQPQSQHESKPQTNGGNGNSDSQPQQGVISDKQLSYAHRLCKEKNADVKEVIFSLFGKPKDVEMLSKTEASQLINRLQSMEVQQGGGNSQDPTDDLFGGAPPPDDDGLPY